ncbi:hypothetical protein ACFL26_00095 [Patescibacteria group bacterium]
MLTEGEMYVLLKLGRNGRWMSGFALVHDLADLVPQDAGEGHGDWIHRAAASLQELGYVESKGKRREFNLRMYRITSEGQEKLSRSIH